MEHCAAGDPHPDFPARHDSRTIAPTTEPSYEQTFKDVYNHLGQVYPSFEMKHIDWQKVGDELLPEAQKVSSREEFGLLCLRLVVAPPGQSRGASARRLQSARADGSSPVRSRLRLPTG